jgi:hypothetical protein
LGSAASGDGCCNQSAVPAPCCCLRYTIGVPPVRLRWRGPGTPLRAHAARMEGTACRRRPARRACCTRGHAAGRRPSSRGRARGRAAHGAPQQVALPPPPPRTARPSMSRPASAADSRFICGTQDLHKQLELRISAFHGTQDTILYPSCFDANAGEGPGGQLLGSRHPGCRPGVACQARRGSVRRPRLAPDAAPRVWLGPTGGGGGAAGRQPALRAPGRLD